MKFRRIINYETFASNLCDNLTANRMLTFLFKPSKS